MGGVLFIDEAYYLYRPENERDYGQEAIEILLQVMENQRDDLVVILAGYADRMDRFFESNPGFRSRIAHHIDFPDYTRRRAACASPRRCSASRTTASTTAARTALADYIARRARASRISPTPARSATRSTARGCGRPTACSRRATGPLDAEAPVDHRGRGHHARAGCSPCPATRPLDGRQTHDRQDRSSPRRSSRPTSRGSATRSRPSPRPAPTGSTST